jgi:hypothetical protein
MKKRGFIMADKKYFRPAVITFTILISSSILFLGGCVERKLTINTEPQGALVTLNDEEIGISPVTIEFNWYGDYNVRIAKQGYETLNTHRELKGPLHDHFPFDFFAEVLWPGRVVDEYEWSFQLNPYEAINRDELLQAAKIMKQKAATEIPQAKKEIEEEKATKKK